MLKQASIRQIQQGEVTRQHGYIVAGMCFYPRGLKKDLLDEYRADLAPDRELFQDFKTQEALVGHLEAFAKCDYENRFSLSRRALETLKRFADLSQKQDVYLACQCNLGEKCHREILLHLAEKAFGAQVGPIYQSYDIFLLRLPEILNSLPRL